MKMIVGLGNPGKEYEQTRHNAGFLWLDNLTELLELPAWSMQKKFQAEIIKNQQLLLVKPQTFMNLSGQATRALTDYYEVNTQNDLLVAFDDLDLEVGTWKMQFGKGPHGHNGLESIYQHLGSKEFMHLRIGVDGRAGARTCPPQNYVLQKFPPTELELLKTCFSQINKQISLN